MVFRRGTRLGLGNHRCLRLKAGMIGQILASMETAGGDGARSNTFTVKKSDFADRTGGLKMKMMLNSSKPSTQFSELELLWSCK